MTLDKRSADAKVRSTVAGVARWSKHWVGCLGFRRVGSCQSHEHGACDL